MSTLTGNKISLTYKSLIKTADNDVLTAVLKELSDGLGNNSGVFLNTGGDLKSTGILEFANFKGTSTSVTINKLVNEADGISNNDNDTSLATSAAVKDYVDTHVTTQDLDFSDGTNPGAVDLDSQVFAIVGTSNEIETSASGQQLQIGLPNDVTISGTFFATEFQGALAGTINSGTTATTQTAGDNSTKVATTAYVDTLDAASDLDFSADSGTGAVNLNTQVFAVTGTATQIETRVSGQGIILNLDASGVLLPNGSEATTQSAGDNSTKVATTAYVDVLDAASDLDIAGDTGTGDVNLNTQTFTLSGTTNQVITSVSGQEATFSLPSTVHRDLQGNVTGDLTGNADTATAWQTARDLILSSEATGTISNVDGTQNVTGAVTLLNSAVTGKVLTGLPTPAAGNIQSSDTILEAFGKLQSQVSSISNGLIFKGSWDAATNTPTLTSGGGEVDSGTTTGQTAFKLIETGQNFNTTVTIGDKVINQVDGTTALVTVIDSNTQLTLDADIMLSGEAYTIDASPFIPQGNYYVVNYAGTTNLNGITDWSIGDWVIADADNRWSKLDHSQVDGQGTPGHLPVFATATTIGDSIVAQSGTALTVTGSLSTTLGASVTGDFAVNTDKFTVAAASGNTAIAGNVSLPDNKKLLLGAGNDLQIYHDGTHAVINGTTGNTYLSSASSLFLRTNGTETAIKASQDSSVELYYDNSKKFETTSTGVSVTGEIVVDGTTSAIANSGVTLKRTGVLTGGADILLAGVSGSEALTFRVNDSEKIRIQDNGNVGINNTNPSAFNSLGGGGLVIGDGTQTNNLTLFSATTGGAVGYGHIAFADSNSSGSTAQYAGLIQYYHGTNEMSFYTDATPRMRIDSLGVVQIKNDSTTTSGPTLRLDANAKASWVVGDIVGELDFFTSDPSGNAPYSTAFIQSQNETGAGTLPSGSLVFGTATYNAVGGAVERMRIDSSGNVGIGVTPNAPANGLIQLDVGDNGCGMTSRQNNELVLQANANYGTYAQSGKPATRLNLTNTGEFHFLNAPAGAAVGDTITFTERMRIDSLGNSTFAGDVIIENSLPTITLKSTDNSAVAEDIVSSIDFYAGDTSSAGQAINAKISSYATDAFGRLGLQFLTGGSGVPEERMRITSGGDVLFGTTGTPNGTSVYGSAFVPLADDRVSLLTSTSATNSQTLIAFYNPNGQIGTIRTSGSSTLYNTTSDYRLKEDLQDFAGLDMVSKIPVYDFKWKTDESRSYGVMAHELQEVLPDAVSGDKDAEEMQSVDYSKIVPLLVKSIQELTAKVDKLEQECKCK